MAHSPRPAARRTLSGLALLALLAAPGAAVARERGRVHVDQALYAATLGGFRHFAEDTLGDLLAGHSWEWQGRRYEATRLLSIQKLELTRAKAANRDYDAPKRGWAVAVINVKVDGRLVRGRVELTANYEWQPAGWAWERGLLYLGVGDSYDFVERTIQ